MPSELEQNCLLNPNKPPNTPSNKSTSSLPWGQGEKPTSGDQYSYDLWADTEIEGAVAALLDRALICSVSLSEWLYIVRRGNMESLSSDGMRKFIEREIRQFEAERLVLTPEEVGALVKLGFDSIDIAEINADRKARGRRRKSQ